MEIYEKLRLSVENDQMFDYNILYKGVGEMARTIFHVDVNSAFLLARLGWFCPVASEPVKPYFTRFLRVLTFCLGASKIVILEENGVVNGVVE